MLLKNLDFLVLRLCLVSSLIVYTKCVASWKWFLGRFLPNNCVWSWSNNVCNRNGSSWDAQCVFFIIITTTIISLPIFSPSYSTQQKQDRHLVIKNQLVINLYCCLDCWGLNFYITSHLSLWSPLDRPEIGKPPGWKCAGGFVRHGIATFPPCFCFLFNRAKMACILLSRIIKSCFKGIINDWVTNKWQTNRGWSMRWDISNGIVQMLWPCKRNAWNCWTKQCTKLPLPQWRTIWIQFCILFFSNLSSVNWCERPHFQ